jgi:hypothetical protein
VIVFDPLEQEAAMGERVVPSESDDRTAPEGPGALQTHNIRLRPDLVLLPLDDEIVAFSEEAQRLAGLNAAAAYLVRRMQSGAPVSGLAQSLVSDGLAPPEEADQWVTMALDALGSNGFLADQAVSTASPSIAFNDARHLARMAQEMPVFTPAEAVVEQRYCLLDTCMLVRFGHRGQRRLVDSVIGHLKTDAAIVPTVTLDISAEMLANGHIHSNVYRDGVPMGYAQRLTRLGPLVLGIFWSAAINQHNFLFYIHAGAVGLGDACILLPAAPGSGKSSLTAALTHRGFRYFSDEIALIEPGTFMVNPMPLAVCAKSTGWNLIAGYYPGILSAPTHGRSDGKIVRYAAPPAARIQKTAASVTHIVFPRYDKASKTELRPMARSDALGHLMSECMALRQRLDQNNVQDLLRWIGGIQCHALPFSSLEEAADLVARMVTSES